MTADLSLNLNTLLTNAKTVAVFFPADAPTDVVLSAVAFAQGVASLGKSVTISSPEPVRAELHAFDGVAGVTQELGNKNLDVSFPYQEDQVDKVSYNIDEETKTFHLVVQPKSGVKPLDSSVVKFTLTGAEADLIVTFAIEQLEDLDQLYDGYQDLFQTTSIVSINTEETTYGTLKLSTAGSASYAEVIAYVLQELGATISAPMATSLLAAIEAATNRFSSSAVTAQTFQTAGRMLELGAERIQPPQPMAAKPVSAGAFAHALGKNDVKVVKAKSTR